jgi:hypothetical protein
MADSDRLVRVLSQILPRELRERVFEPALADLLSSEAGVPRTARRWVARLTLVLECFRLSIPRLIWQRRRPTPLAVGVLVMLMLLRLLLARQHYMQP